MRIVIFSDTFPPDINGAATSTGNLYKTLKDHGEEVMVVTSNSIYAPQSDYLSGIIRLKGIRFKKIYNYVISGFGNKKTMDILKAYKPDVCHIQTDGPIGQFGFEVAKKTNAAIVYTFHTSLEDYTYYVTGGWFFDKSAKKIVRSYIRVKGKRINGLIVPSQKTAEYMRSLDIKSEPHVIPTGIDFSRFQERDETKIGQFRASLGLSQDNYVFVYLGRLAKEKSIDTLLQGFADYLKGHKDEKAKFLVVGGGPDLHRLKDIAKDLGISDRVVFTDAVKPEETPNYYHLGDAYAFASTTETQGLTYLEAMAASLPVIIRYDESNKDVIEDGVNGFVYHDPKELKDVFEKVRELSSKERNNIIENGYKVLESYSLDAFYGAVMKVYKLAKEDHEQKRR